MAVEFNKPVSMSIGEQIQLPPLKGKLVAIKVIAREEVKTKFGVRTCNTVKMAVEGQTEPLIGGIFSSYFKRLNPNEWYAGRIIKDESGETPRWGLSEMTVKDSKKIAALMDVAAVADQE